MEIIRGNDFKLNSPVAVTIGKYEAIHCGHKILLGHIEHYKNKGYSPVIFTFDIHPGVQFGNNAMQLIYTNEEKESILAEHNIDYMIEYPFTDEIISMSPEEFFEDILIKKVNAKVVIVGEDFRFGHNRSGDVITLEHLGHKHNVKIDVISKQCIADNKISSSIIREVISKGDMELACRMLGRPYSVSGVVVHGKQLGRTIGMPTINIIPDKSKLLPPRGVYSSVVALNGKRYPAVTNIGYKPTVKGDKSINVESYIFDFDGDIYGENVTVELVHYQRPEQKFDNLEALKEQINKDIIMARSILTQSP